ncbi:MAG: DNA adenine methylase [Solirubrobacteraceae bacterium]|nr:DNA adenine methylase [Solirubrobacteraceae bacterium]
MSAPFAWYGGKQRLAGRIVDLLPPHSTYVEAFGGAAAVLCAKRPATLEPGLHHVERLWPDDHAPRASQACGR